MTLYYSLVFGVFALELVMFLALIVSNSSISRRFALSTVTG